VDSEQWTGVESGQWAVGRRRLSTAHYPLPTILLFALTLCGCDRGEAYLEIARAQQVTWDETAGVLASVKDAASMDAARDRFAELTVKGQTLARRAKSLPRPSDSVLERLEEERGKMERAANRMRGEVARVGQLPGGAEFLKDIEIIVRGSR
jgi:hypothetical protein